MDRPVIGKSEVHQKESPDLLYIGDHFGAAQYRQFKLDHLSFLKILQRLLKALESNAGIDRIGTPLATTCLHFDTLFAGTDLGDLPREGSPLYSQTRHLIWTWKALIGGYFLINLLS